MVGFKCNSKFHDSALDIIPCRIIGRMKQVGVRSRNIIIAPPSQPSQVASIQAPATPASVPQSPPVQGDTAVRQLDAQEIATLFNRGRHLDAEEIATLVNRGTDSLKSGDIASARLLLRRAAEAGSASAALMLGTTFDPLAIKQLGAIGVVPDVAQARQWYEKALELGSEAASQRLAKLAHTGQ